MANNKIGLTAEQRITRAKVALMGNPSTMVYSGILLLGTTEIRDDFPTAGTNGLDTIYGRKFVDSLDDAELRGIVLHEEGGHKMYRHPLVWRHLYEKGIMAVSKNDKTGEELRCNVANIAADYVVNADIKELEEQTGGFVKLPKHGLYDKRFKGMSVGQVFNILVQENPPQNGGGGGGNGDGSGGGQQCDMPGKPEQQFDEHDWDHAKGMTESEQANYNAAVDGAIRQGALLAGNHEGNMPRSFTELMEPQVKWEDQLREFVISTSAGKDTTTWRRPSRRFLHQDIYMPSSISENIESVVVAIDTSGSIYGAVLNAFISETAKLMEVVNPEKVDLLYWDTKVAGHETYGSGEFQHMIASTKPKGGGGTDPRCIALYLTKKKIKPQCVVTITDGYFSADVGKWDCPTLWVVVDNKSFTSEVGQTIHINSELYKD